MRGDLRNGQETNLVDTQTVLCRYYSKGNRKPLESCKQGT